MKVIFLDIDGVLNHKDTFKQGHKFHGCFGIQPELAQKLNRITDATGAVLVLSSAWRKVRTWEENMEYFKQQGITGKFKGQTPVCDTLSGTSNRGEEIAEWLVFRSEWIDSFIVLDDIKVKRYQDRQILTIEDVGLTDEDVEKAIKMLEG